MTVAYGNPDALDRCVAKALAGVRSASVYMLVGFLGVCQTRVFWALRRLMEAGYVVTVERTYRLTVSGRKVFGFESTRSWR